MLATRYPRTRQLRWVELKRFHVKKRWNFLGGLAYYIMYDQMKRPIQTGTRVWQAQYLHALVRIHALVRRRSNEHKAKLGETENMPSHAVSKQEPRIVYPQF
jgi:hypothetical protein